MKINGVNYLLLERRGCNFMENDEICSRSDVGNYRVYVEFTDKKGVAVCGDFGRTYVYDTTKRKPRIVNDIALHTDFQFENERGTWVYNPAVDPKAYAYNLADILKFINAISAEHYDAIKWVKYINVTQQRDKKFTPDHLIVEYAKRNHLEISREYSETILHMYTGKYKYLAYSIEALSDTTEGVCIIMEEAA